MADWHELSHDEKVRAIAHHLGVDDDTARAELAKIEDPPPSDLEGVDMSGPPPRDTGRIFDR